MPCNHHEHSWPTEGVHILIIELCETHCGWCSNYNTNQVTNLRAHARTHLKNTSNGVLSGITIQKQRAGRPRVQLEQKHSAKRYRTEEYDHERPVSPHQSSFLDLLLEVHSTDNSQSQRQPITSWNKIDGFKDYMSLKASQSSLHSDSELIPPLGALEEVDNSNQLKIHGALEILTLPSLAALLQRAQGGGTEITVSSQDQFLYSDPVQICRDCGRREGLGGIHMLIREHQILVMTRHFLEAERTVLCTHLAVEREKKGYFTKYGLVGIIQSKMVGPHTTHISSDDLVFLPNTYFQHVIQGT